LQADRPDGGRSPAVMVSADAGRGLSPATLGRRADTVRPGPARRSERDALAACAQHGACDVRRVKGGEDCVDLDSRANTYWLYDGSRLGGFPSVLI